MGLDARKPDYCIDSWSYFAAGSNNSADQPVYLRSLISAFGIRYLQSTMLQLAPRQESLFELVFVAEQAGLGLTCSGIPNSFFSRQCP